MKYRDREIEIECSGTPEEPAAESGNYTDGAMEDLTEDELYEIGNLYAGEISQELMEWAMANAYDRAKDIQKYGH